MFPFDEIVMRSIVRIDEEKCTGARIIHCDSIVTVTVASQSHTFKNPLSNENTTCARKMNNNMELPCSFGLYRLVKEALDCSEKDGHKDFAHLER